MQVLHMDCDGNCSYSLDQSISGILLMPQSSLSCLLRQTVARASCGVKSSRPAPDPQKLCMRSRVEMFSLEASLPTLQILQDIELECSFNT